MPALLRKLALTLHIACSVGWFGAVASFLALAIAGLTSRDAQVVQVAYLAMDVITSTVIVPLSLAALLTGIVQALGTKWGLFRYYWVFAKLLITVVSTITLLTHTEAIRYLATVAAVVRLSSDDFGRLRFDLATTAGAAALTLLVTTALSVYKPGGLTPYGRRRQRELHSQLPSEHTEV